MNSKQLEKELLEHARKWVYKMQIDIDCTLNPWDYGVTMNVRFPDSMTLGEIRDSINYLKKYGFCDIEIEAVAPDNEFTLFAKPDVPLLEELKKDADAWDLLDSDDPFGAVIPAPRSTAPWP